MHYNLPCEQDINKLVVEKLAEKIGKPSFAGDSDINDLIDAIIDVTNCRLGLNTVKRIVGTIDYTGHIITDKTLSIVARFLGHPTWDELVDYLSNPDQQIPAGFAISHIIQYDERYDDMDLDISYLPNRKLCLRCINANKFKVVSSTSNHIRNNDLIIFEHLKEGERINIGSVIRDNDNKGAYTGGIITEIIKHQPNEDA